MSILLINRARVVGSGGGVEPFFSDSFAGLQKNDSNGFTWGSASASVSVVSFDGYNCLRFRYIGKVTGQDGDSEQRFNMGRSLNEVYIRYWLHIPSNFEHRGTEPDGVENNKFFVLWRDNYSGTGHGEQAFALEYTNYTNTDIPRSTYRLLARRVSGGSIDTMTDIVGDNENGDPFIGGTGPLVVGGWNQVDIHAKGSSAFGVSDGRFRLRINGTVFQDLNGFPFHNVFASPADVLYKQGYFMGYSNSGFTNETDFHIRDVAFYESSPGW